MSEPVIPERALTTFKDLVKERHPKAFCKRNRKKLFMVYVPVEYGLHALGYEGYAGSAQANSAWQQAWWAVNVS